MRRGPLVELALGHGVGSDIVEQQAIEPHDETCGCVTEDNTTPLLEAEDAAHASPNRLRHFA